MLSLSLIKPRFHATWPVLFGSGGYEPEALDLFIRMQSARETIGID